MRDLISAFDNSSCVRDISRLGAKRRRRHSETCEAVSETSGWSPVARTKPSGLSFDRRFRGYCKKMPPQIKDFTMEQNLMQLKILLPFEIFLEKKEVKRIVAETNAGSFGMLPQRLDCVAALVPGIFEYETAQGIVYVAVDEGIMIKAGTEVMVSVRNAHGGTDLGKLHESIEKEFVNLDENEKNVRYVMEKLGSTLIQHLEKFQKE